MADSLSFKLFNALSIGCSYVFCSHNEILQHSKNGSVTALIWGASPQTRSDRRKDRVETHPEQLAAASAQAEISFASFIIMKFL